MSQVTVSLITFTALPHAKRCIASLLRQRGPEWNAILTSNGLPMVTAYFQKLAAADPRFRVVVNATNEGFIPPNVKALSMTEAPFFLMLNDDTQLPPNGLEKLLEAFSVEEKIALVGVAGGCSELGEDFLGRRGDKLEYVEGACLMCRTELVKKYGLFDPKLQFAYAEDSDLSLRMRQLGYGIRAIPLQIQHVRCATSRFSHDVQKYFKANHDYCRAKWADYLKTRTFQPRAIADEVKETPVSVVVEPIAPPPTAVVSLVPTLTVVTCTGDRPEAFALAEKYVKRQTTQPLQWLVLDDGKIPTKCTMDQEYIYNAKWIGRNSMISKLLHAVSTGIIRGDALVFWEDDDWYAPTWLETLAGQLKTADVVGEGRAIYYNVRNRWWYGHENIDHASLCETAVSKKFFPVLMRLLNQSVDPYVDGRIWAQPKFSHSLIDPNTLKVRRSLGIKAMPGRPGYGSGHGKRDKHSQADPQCIKLRELIGQDADTYLPFGFFK